MTRYITTLRKAFLLEDGGVISLVGAGGKTSLMFRIAGEISKTGETVLTATTTRILFPTRHQSSSVLLASSLESIREKAPALLKDTPHLTAAPSRAQARRDKLNGFQSDFINALWRTGLFQWIVIEADGAAGRPLKAPAPHEPVIPGCTQRLIGVVGLKGIGKSLADDWVFRPELFARITGTELKSPVTETAVAAAILDGDGIMKGAPAGAEWIVFLNLAGDQELLESGRKIAQILCQNKENASLKRVVIGNALDEPAVIEYYDLER